MMHAGIRARLGLTVFVSLLIAGLRGEPAAADPAAGGCCADLEDRIAILESVATRRGNRKIELTISGVVNRALLGWDDGVKVRAYVVDPAIDSTSFKFEGAAKFSPGWKAGYLLKIDSVTAPSDSVDQNNPAGEGQETKADRFFVFLQNETLGKVAIGRNNAARRGIDNMEFTGAESTDAEIPDWGGGLLLRSRSGQLLDLPWGDFLLGKIAGIKDHLVVYATPSLRGFEASVAWGSNDYWDVALRYRDTWHKTVKVKAGVGYFSNTSEKDAENVRDIGWGGSLALLHIPTGLNIAFNHGRMEHTTNCLEAGAVSGRCRGPDIFHYVRGGILREYFSIGPTAIYGEYYRGRSQHNLSDQDTLDALALNPLAAPAEMARSASHVWGFGVTQHIKAVNMALYAGYRHHQLDVELVDAAGVVADKGLKDLQILFAGIRIEF